MDQSPEAFLLTNVVVYRFYTKTGRANPNHLLPLKKPANSFLAQEQVQESKNSTSKSL